MLTTGYIWLPARPQISLQNKTTTNKTMNILKSIKEAKSLRHLAECQVAMRAATGANGKLRNRWRHQFALRSELVTTKLAQKAAQKRNARAKV